MKRAFLTLLTIALLLMSSPARADDDKNDRRIGFLPIAVPFYLPETSVGVGWTLFLYQTPAKDDPDRRPDEAALNGAATLRKQFTGELALGRYFQSHAYHVSEVIDANVYPDYTWGVGPRTPESAKERFTSRLFSTNTTFLARIAPKLYVGPSYFLRVEELVDRAAGPLAGAQSIHGASGTRVSAPGLDINYDTRDSVFYPHRGLYLDGLAQFAAKAFGGLDNFSKYTLDARGFIGLGGEHVIALQGYAEISAGAVPFEMMPRLGGQYLLRGYYKGRYRDRAYVAAQAEYRFPIYWRFGGDLFAAAGQVGPSLREMPITHLKAAGGVGLRFAAVKDDHINVRLDTALNVDGDLSFYLTVREAF